MNWLSFRRAGRRRSPFNNLGPEGLTAGRVTPHLWVGGELGPDDWRALTREGISAVINLQQEQQDTFSPREVIDGYLWLPAPDGMAPSLQQLAMGVEFIEAATHNNQSVFVHCKAGQGRAPLLCACYLIHSEGLKPLQALARVREARPRTQLTPEQGVRLREFAARYKAPDAELDAEEVVAVAPTKNGAANGQSSTQSRSPQIRRSHS